MNSFCLYCPGRQTCQDIVNSSNENFRAPERELFLYAICTFQRIETDFYVKTICGHFLIYDDIGFLALDVAKEARIIEFEKCPVRSFAALWHHQQLHGLFAADSSDRNLPRKAGWYPGCSQADLCCDRKRIRSAAQVCRKQYPDAV